MDASNSTTSPLADDIYCLARNASYLTRVDNPDAYDWCIVPNSSYDVILFAGLAVVLASLVQGKHATLVILLAGGALMGLAWGVNLGQLGNSIAWWLGISPWQLFFYMFLPPLLLDAAVRIDWFIFKKIMVQVITLAFLVVGLSCAVMIPIMLYMLNLKADGWNWAHACMFGAMVASTDAVAIVAVMKTGGGPKQLRSLLEGESLLNDASGLTLFEIFFHYVIEYADPKHAAVDASVGHILQEVVVKIIQFGGIGAVMGFAFGVATRVMLRFMRRVGASRDQEVGLTVAMAYLAYYITQNFCMGSGVVAVAVMGLYGAATGHWDMSTSVHEEGTFDGFWDTLAFIVNGIVFFYSGASCVNFFVRSSKDLLDAGAAGPFAKTLWMVPIIYVILSLLRFLLIALFRPLFIATKGDISFREAAFVAVAGLRGSVSLIMGQAVVTERALSGEIPIVKAQIVFWTAGFVLLTLVFNAPLLPRVLRWLKLNRIPVKQLRRRQRAIEALGEHTQEIIQELRDDEDELLSGVDWAQVERFVDMPRRLQSFGLGPDAPRKRKLNMLIAFCMRCCGKKPPQDGKGRRRTKDKRARLGGRGGAGDDEASHGGYRKASTAAYLGADSATTHANGEGTAKGDLENGTRGLGRRSSLESSSSGDESDASNVLHDVLGTWFHDMEDIDVLHQEVPFLFKQQTRPQDLADHQRHAQQVVETLKGQAAEGGPGAAAALSAINNAAHAAAEVLAKQEAGQAPKCDEEAQPKLQLLASLAKVSAPLPDAVKVAVPSSSIATSSAAPSSSTDAEAGVQAGTNNEQQLLPAGTSSIAHQQQLPVLQTVPSAQPLDPMSMPTMLDVTRAASASLDPAQPIDKHAALQQPQPGSPRHRPSTSSSSSGAPAAAAAAAATATAAATVAAAVGAGGAAAGSTTSGMLARLSPLHLFKPAASTPPSSATPPQLRSLATRSTSMYTSYEDQQQQHGREMQAIGVSKGRVYKNLARSSQGLDAGAVASPGGQTGGLGRHSVNLGRGSVGLARGSVGLTGSRHVRHGSGGPEFEMASVAEDRGHWRHSSEHRDLGEASPAPPPTNDDPGPGPRRMPTAGAQRSLATRSQAAYLVPRMQDLGRLSHHPERPHTPQSPHSPPHSPFAQGSEGPFAVHKALGTRSMPAPYHGGSGNGTAAAAAPQKQGLAGQYARKSRALGAISSLQRHEEEVKEEQELQEDELADARVWLVSGLKRYFHGKRMAGLLSSRGLRILDFACDMVLDEPYKPLSLWGIMQKDAASNLVVKATTTMLFGLRRTAIALMRPELGHTGRVLSVPFRFAAGLLQTPLNKLLLLSVEVAMEYLMGLTSSPYVQWLQESEVWGALLAEIQDESSQVWQFLIDREIEAPERYSAIQSYRAAMAILKQQMQFVEELFESGMIDDLERDIMRRPIDSQERLLEFLGPTWRAPNTTEVVANLPFMRHQRQSMCSFFIKHGRLAMFSSSSKLPNSSDDVYVVTSGIVKVTYKPDMGAEQEYFLGTGGIYNLYHCLTQEHLPGTVEAVAQGNVLGKGPVCFILSRKALDIVRASAAADDPAFGQLELDMYRLAALFVLERLKPQLLLDARQALRPAAPPLAQVQSDDVEAVRQGRAAQVGWLHKKVGALRASIKLRVAYGELHELPPGGTLHQTSSVVLMRGAVESHCEAPPGSSALATMALRHMTCSGRHVHNGVLPWVWEVLTPQELALAQEHVPREVPLVTLTAGPQGATLIVCPAPGHEQRHPSPAPGPARTSSLPPGDNSQPPGPAASQQLPTVRFDHGAAAADGGSGPRERRRSGTHAAQLPDTLTMGQRHMTRVRSSRALTAAGSALALGEQGPGAGRAAGAAAALAQAPQSRPGSRPGTDGGTAGAAGAPTVRTSGRGRAEEATSATAAVSGAAGDVAGSSSGPFLGFKRASFKALNVPQGGKGTFERVVSSNGRNRQQ